MKLLLHTCCAPCAIYPAQEAIKDGFEVTGFFYNPNIQPCPEYVKRRKETETYFKSGGLELIFTEYEPDNFFKSIAKKCDTPTRCSVCWFMRLENTALFAKENGFEAFSTTLLGSPYQDQEALMG